MNKTQKHLENIEQLQKVIQFHPSIEEMKKSLILEKIEEWRNEEEAMSIIPNKLLELYKDDIEPILVEVGLI